MFKIRHLLLIPFIALCVPLASAQTVINGKGSTFVLNYDAIYDQTMQGIINDAALFWADSVRSTVPISVNVNAVNLSCNYSYNGHVDTQPPASAINFANAPLANTYYPIALANALAGVDLQPATADIELNFNKKMITNFFCPRWYLGYDDNYTFLEFSLYFETMQDIAHGLGLIPLGNLMTGQKLNGYNDIYWTKLKSEKSNAMLTELSTQQIVDVAHDALNLAFKGEKSWAAAENITYSRTSDAILLFSRSYDARALTGSHVHESTGPLQLLTLDLRGGIPQTDLTLAMLEDLGWRSTRNAEPVIEGQQAININEDTSYVLSLADLTVADEEPTALTVQFGTGNHFALNGNTLTPDANFFGTLTVPVTVSDAEYTSAPFNLSITVLPVNDLPNISAQQTLSLNEDSQLTLTPAMFSITDSDSSDFTLQVASGNYYSVDGTKVIPAANFHGTLTVPVQAHDGSGLSNLFNATVTVNAVNDAPFISGQTSVKIEEEAPFTLTPALLILVDIDSTQFTLSAAPGSNYTLVGNTLTPASNFNGLLSVIINVNDGDATSNSFALIIEVMPTNDAPVITGQTAITIDEDSTLTVTPNLVSFEDVDSTSFQLLATAGEHYQVSGNLLIPDIDFFGSLTVPMQISDGIELSNIFQVNITVLPVNDAPIIENIAAQTIYEDASFFVNHEILTVYDPDDSEFTVSIERGDHYRVAGNEIIPDANWFGELAIGITINDGEFDSNSVSLLLTVTEINDLPEFTTTSLPVGQIYRPWLANLSASDVDGDTLAFAFKTAPSWLTISEQGEISAMPNENMIGEHDLEISVSDGRATISEWFTLTILNDATASDVSVSLATERTIWSTNGWVPVTLTATNAGPKTNVNATLTIQFPEQWSTQDSRCDTNLNRCDLNLTEQTSFVFSVRQNMAGSADLLANIYHEGFETDASNNQARLTLTFSDALPTSPQYSVPAFGQGHVRAIGLANVQGGRWPEIMFANGALEASTVYKFEKSLFRPELHSHLGDASNSYAMALFDIDNDGDIDWVLANGQGEGNTVYLNNGQGLFTLTDVLGHYDSRAVAFGDIDRDGDQDLVFANNEDPNTLYLNNGDGTFTLHHEFASRRSRAVIVYDFNRDGQPDILFANRGWRNRIYFGRGYAGHKRSTTRTLINQRASDLDTAGFDDIDFGEEGDLTSRALLADLDGDGIASDIVLVNDASDTQSASLQMFAVDDQGHSQMTGEADTGTVADLSIGDYDGDGKDDIAVLRPGGAMEVMANSGGTLNTIEVMDTDGADTILLVDVDGSGKADVISANNSSQSSRLDFAGDVVDDEASIDTDGSTAVTLPFTPKPTSYAAPRAKKGGAGVPFMLLPLLWWLRRQRK